MLQKSDVLESMNTFLNPGGYAVVDAIPIFTGFDEILNFTDLFFGELRIQGLDGKVGEVELRAQNPTDTTKFEMTLKTTVIEGESKSFINVLFNKIQKYEDLNAYFVGYKLVTNPIQIPSNNSPI